MRAVLTCFVAMAFLVASGQEMYSNFGSGDSFDMANAWRVSRQFGLAMPFSPAFTGELGSVSLPLMYEGHQTYVILVCEDANGEPGHALMTWDVIPAMNITTLPAQPGIVLAKGQSYWLVARLAFDSPQDGGWFLNSIGDSGPFLRLINGQWTSFSDTRSVYKITASTRETYVPDAFAPEQGKGKVTTGNLASLQTDDSDFLNTRAEIQRVSAELNATEKIETHVTGRAYASGEVKAIMRATPARGIAADYAVTAHNYATGQEVIIGQGTLPASGSEISVALPLPGSVADFIEQSTGKMQVRVVAKTGKLTSGILILGIDLVQWTLQR